MSKKTISIRITEETHQQLKKLAEADHRTVSAYIEWLIIQKLSHYVAPDVTNLQIYPKVLSEEEIKEIYKK